MADRLTDLVLGLQRLAENAKLRGDDLRYTQAQETKEHIDWLDHLLHMVEEVRGVFLQERKRFLPVERERPPLMPHQQDAAEKMPRIVKQGPAA